MTEKQQHKISDHTWATIEPLVSGAVKQAMWSTNYAESDLRLACGRLAEWVHEYTELELNARTVLDGRTIEKFITKGLDDYLPSSRGNIRTILLRVSEAVLGDKALRPHLSPLPRSDAKAPYSRKELRSLTKWLDSIEEKRRGDASVLLALGFGAGLTAGEIGTIRVGDVRTAKAGTLTVNVPGSRARKVAIGSAWTSAVIESSAGRSQTEWLFLPKRVSAGKNLVTNFVVRIHPRFLGPDTQRMRASWIVNQLNAGTDVRALTQAAGMQTIGALDRYYQFVDESKAA